MPTNLHVNDQLLNEAKDLGGSKTKREAVEAALQHYIGYLKRLKALDSIGTIDFDPAYDIKMERRKRTAKLERLGVLPPMPKTTPRSAPTRKTSRAHR